MILVLNNEPCLQPGIESEEEWAGSPEVEGYCSQKEQGWRRFREAGLAAAERLRPLCVHITNVMAEPGRRLAG